MKLDFFEPHEPILNKEDFLLELYRFKDENRLDFTVLKVGMEPEIEYRGERYVCMLEHPRLLGNYFFASNTMGYKFVYFHKLDS